MFVGLAVRALPGLYRAAAEQGLLHTVPFSLKLGAGGVQDGHPYSVSSPFGTRGGIQKEAPSSFALTDPASTAHDPTSGEQSGPERLVGSKVEV